MDKQLTLFTGKGLAELKDNLPTLPLTKDNYVLAVNLKSLTNSKAFTDWLAAGFDHVSTCKDCEEMQYQGFGIKLITQTKKVWRETPETKRIMKAIEASKLVTKNLEIDLKAAQEKAGYDEEPGLAYYKAV
jgi:hypothetical protein